MSVEDEYQGDDSNVVKDLRKQLKSKDSELTTLRASHRERTFKDAGFDPAKGVGKLLAGSYDGEITVDAIHEYAKTEGLEVPTSEPERPAPPEPSERQQSQRRVAEMRQSGETAQSGLVDYKDWMELAMHDEGQAEQMILDGKVDFPDHIAEQLTASWGADARRTL